MSPRDAVDDETLDDGRDEDGLSTEVGDGAGVPPDDDDPYRALAGPAPAGTVPAGTGLPRQRGALVERSRHRYIGPDVVRAVALIGVVLMNYHGYLIHRGAQVGTSFVNQMFDPWDGPFATRFAATFVLIAGVGTTLLTRSVMGDRRAIRARRFTLVRRGLILFVGGMFLNEIWDGTILPYYGAMFVVGALIFTWRSWAIALLGIAAAVAGMVIHGYALARAADEDPIAFLAPSGRWSPHAILVNTFVEGTHPLLPWLAFYCAGMILARHFSSRHWRTIVIPLGIAGYVIGRICAGLRDDGSITDRLLWDGPWERSLPFVVSALGTALVATAVVSWLAERFADSRIVDWLRHAGQMTLTIYVAHALVFNLIVDWLGWVRPTGLDTAVLLSAGFWVVAIAFGAWWHRHVGIGPLEWVYRELSA